MIRLANTTTSDIDILAFYLSGLKPARVHSFGSLAHFKKARKPAEAGDATKCLSCPAEPNCVWSAKKIYLEPLGQKDSVKVRNPGPSLATLFLDAFLYKFQSTAN